MSRRFCAECGNTGVSLVDNFCESCYWKFNKIINVKNNKIDVAYCLTCYSVKLPTGWSNSNAQKEMPEIVGYGYLRNVIARLEVDIDFFGYSDNIHWLDPNPELKLTYIGKSTEHKEFEVHEEYIDVDIKLIGGICKSCVRRKTGTHDVTVQLRADRRDLSKIEVDKATTIIFNITNKLFHESSDSYVSDIIENHGGLDFYLGNLMVADEFINALKKTWIGHHEKNYKLITEERDNTRVYRVTHLYRIPKVRGGEIAIYQNELHFVIKIKPSSVSLINLRTRETVNVSDWKNLSNPDISPYTIRKLIVSKDLLTKSYLLMDLTTFENEEINMDQFPIELAISEEIEFLVWNDNYYLPSPKSNLTHL